VIECKRYIDCEKDASRQQGARSALSVSEIPAYNRTEGRTSFRGREGASGTMRRSPCIDQSEEYRDNGRPQTQCGPQKKRSIRQPRQVNRCSNVTQATRIHESNRGALGSNSKSDGHVAKGQHCRDGSIPRPKREREGLCNRCTSAIKNHVVGGQMLK